MATTKNEFTFVINAVDHATASLVSVRRQLDSVSQPIERINRNYAHLKRTIEPLANSLDELTGRFENLSAFTSTRLALPTAAFGGYVLKQAADFEAATNKVKVLAGYAEDFTEQAKADMRSLEEMARTLGKELKFGPTDVMLGFGELLSNDPNLAKAKASIKPVLNLSLAADIAPAAAARIVNAMGSSFETLSPTQSSNLLARLQAISSVKLSDFSETISNVAGQAMLRGEDPTALLSASAVLSRSLIDKSKAGSHLEIFYKRLSNSLVDTGIQEALGKMGFGKKDIFENVGGVDRLRSLNELLPKFAKVMNNPNLSKVFGEDAISSVLVLLKNYSLFLSLRDDLRSQLTKTDSTGSAALQAAVSSQGLKGSFEQLKGSLEEFSIALAKSGLLKEVTDIVQAATRLTDSMGRLDSGILSALTNLGAMVLAMSGFLALASPFLRILQAFNVLPALGAGAAATGVAGATAATGGAALGGFSVGALSSGAGALAGLGVAGYLINKDMVRGNLFSEKNEPLLSRTEFQSKLLTGAQRERNELYQKLISGEELTLAEKKRAVLFAKELDPRKTLEGPAFSRETFTVGRLMQKMKEGGKLDSNEAELLNQIRAYKASGKDLNDFLQRVEGQISVDFKNVPPGVEIKKEGSNPAFDLKIDFKRGPVMP